MTYEYETFESLATQMMVDFLDLITLVPESTEHLDEMVLPAFRDRWGDFLHIQVEFGILVGLRVEGEPVYYAPGRDDLVSFNLVSSTPPDGGEVDLTRTWLAKVATLLFDEDNLRWFIVSIDEAPLNPDLIPSLHYSTGARWNR